MALAGLATAAAGCAAPPPPAVSQGPARPPCWEVRAPGASGPSMFLLGSVHLGDASGTSLDPRIEAAYARADELVVEVDLSRVSPAEAGELMRRYGTLPPGRRLRDAVSPQTWARLSEYLTAREIPVSSVERLEPWSLALMLVALEFQTAGYRADRGVDRLFIDRAAGEKSIAGLESFDSQLALLDGLPASLQELMLEDLLVRSDGFGKETAELLDAWRRGDEAALLAILFGPLQESPELEPFYEKVFYERNEAMSAKLAEMARDGKKRFVVLGAGHMVGPRGLPALLAARGFQVERAMVPPPASR